MKTKLLASLLFISIISYSQKNGWYQYHKSGESFAIDSDLSGQIHLGTDTGYLVYDPNTNAVINHANLTSQNLSLGAIRGVKSNPTNNEIVLLDKSGNNIIVYDGASEYIEYNSENSNFEGFGVVNFIPNKLTYSDQGVLYIYNSQEPQYQTFENGTFGAVQNIDFDPNDVIENNDGTKAYFASFTGFWELDKASGTYSNFNTSNSNVHTNFLYALQKDSNGLIYLGGNDGISTYDPNTGVFDLVYEEAFPANPSVMYDVQRLEAFSDDRFFVRTQSSWAILDLNSDQYTHYTNAQLCNPRNVKLVNDEIYVQPAFGDLTIFDPATTSCTELNTNHLNVGDLGSFGTSDSAITTNPTNANEIDVLWTNNAICGASQSCSLFSLSIPLTFSGGSFANTDSKLSVSDAGVNEISILDINSQMAMVVGETNGYRIVKEDGSEEFIPHGIDGYRPFQNKFVVQNQDTQNPMATPKIAVLSGGFDINNEYKNYIGNINTIDNSLSDYIEVSLSNAITSNTNFFGNSQDGITARFYMAMTGVDSNRYAAQLLWDFENGTYQIPFEEDISIYSEFRPDPLSIDDVSIFDMIFQSSPNGNICTRNGNSGSYECNSFDFNNDGLNDFLEIPDKGKAENVQDFDFVEQIVIALGQPTLLTGKKDLKGGSLADLGITFRNNDPSITDFELRGLPEDFFILNSHIFFYSNSLCAVVLSTTYGLLIHTALDYSSLVLSNHEFVLTDKHIGLYPNPADDMVSFSDDSIEKADLFDINGRKVLEVRDTSFSIKNLAQGIYFIKATTNSGTIETGKLIKK